VGQFFPFVCAEATRSSLESCIEAHEKFVKINPITNQQLLSRRGEALKIVETYRKEATALLSKCPAEYRAVLKKILLDIGKYRRMVSSLQTSRDLSHVRCGEQTQEALFKEMLKAKNNQWPKNRPKLVHEISVKNNSGEHAFIVSGSAKLQEVYKINRADEKLFTRPVIIQDSQKIREILKEYDGTVIDQWNNPTAGGVILEADAARKKYNMYGPNTKYTELSIVEIDVLDVHKEIDAMSIPKDTKSELHAIAGLDLEDLERELFPTVHPEF